MSNIVWTPIVKGQRKPPGYVLVTCSYTTSQLEVAIWGGPIETFARIRIGRWNTARQAWAADDPRGEKLKNVTAWAPLPAPYGATE